MINWPPALVTEVAERRVVVFVGAGISKAAHANMPSWPSLLGDMSKKLSKKKDRELVKRLIRYERLLDAAELINSQLLPADRRAILEDRFKITRSRCLKSTSTFLHWTQKFALLRTMTNSLRGTLITTAGVCLLIRLDFIIMKGLFLIFAPRQGSS